MKYFVILFILLLSASTLFSQNFDFEFRPISKNGSFRNNGNAILQDSKGFLWIGTEDGLNRFDGTNFKTYKRKRDPGSNSISGNHISDIYEDKQGNLWVGTSSGLNLYNREKDFFELPNRILNSDSLTDVAISKIYQDDIGNFWIGLIKGGLVLFSKKENSFFYFKPQPHNHHSLSSGLVKDIFQDAKGNLLVGTEAGLNLFNYKTKTFKRLSFENSIVTHKITRIKEDGSGNLWVGTTDGLYLFNLSSSEFTKIKTSDEKVGSSENVLSILLDRRGKIWVGMENRGLYTLREKERLLVKKKVYTSDNASLDVSSIISIVEDRSGTLWMGVFRGGVYFANPDLIKFKHLAKRRDGLGLSDNKVTSVIADKDENLWAGTDGGGLNKINLKKREIKNVDFSKDKRATNIEVIISMVDDDDKIWIGTYLGSLNSLNKRSERLSSYYLKDPGRTQGFITNSFFSLYKDREGEIYTGNTDYGLVRFNPRSQTVNYYSNGISNTYVSAILEDNKGNLWIGTAWGLNIFNKNNSTFRTYYFQKGVAGSLSDNFIQAIFQDKKKRIWIGTHDGLNLYNPQSDSFLVFNEKNGLPNNNIQSIVEDKNGCLWLGTYNGLCRFNYDKMEARTYRVEDGLPSNEFTPNASTSDKNGNLYFGTLGGVLYFNPDHVRPSSYIPSLAFIDFQIFNTSVKLGDGSPLQESITEAKEIILSYKQTVFSFEFACLDLINPEKISYAYKMENFDSKWNYVNNKRTATYTNLDPGEYTFRVKSSNSDGVWNEKGIAVKIIITPPFWKTWWFNASMGISFFALLYLIYHVKINNVKRQKEKLEKQVEERTAEINEQKIELEAQTEVLKYAYTEINQQKEKVDYLYGEVKNSIRAAQEIQQSILPSKDVINANLPENFILFQPKDSVSGDFYWFGFKDNKCIITVADCTGHGVSGALMSINGHYLLKKAIDESGLLLASDILDRLNSEIISELRLKDQESRSGMDLSLCIIDFDNNELQFSGANHQLYLVRDGELKITKGNKFPIGMVPDRSKPFTNQIIQMCKNDMVYMFTDGYVDQFGGKDGNEKLLFYRFRELLVEIHQRKSTDQLAALEHKFIEWKGSQEQTDDILILGFRY